MIELVLKQVSFLNYLTEEDFLAICHKFEEVQYPANTLIFEEFSLGDYMFIF